METDGNKKEENVICFSSERTEVQIYIEYMETKEKCLQNVDGTESGGGGDLMLETWRPRRCVDASATVLPSF